VTMQLANLQSTPPPGTTTQYYYVTWTGPDGKQYGVEHVEPANGSPVFEVGQYDTQTNQLVAGTTQNITGSFNPGANGTVVWNVPKSAIGNPTVPVSGSSIPPAFTNPYSLTILGEGSATSGGLVFVQPADRAPNGGFGPKWSVC